MNNHLEYAFEGPASGFEMLIALLSELPFEGFEEQDARLLAYLPESAWTEDLDPQIENVARMLGFSVTRARLEDQNWNALWESNFSPVSIPGYVMIRAEFHDNPPSDAYRHIITITPRMAFGTGHHATTRMMLLEMDELPFESRAVLDYGCGTGILAIVARQKGANPVVAIDIDPNCTENTLINASQNACSLTVMTADIDQIDSASTFDIILANINRNVLIQAIPSLYRMSRPGGHLLLSGFLEEDLPLMRQQLDASLWQETGLRQEEGWVCLVVQRIQK
ncbi:MAG: 50S ribosomal protein L11 methyltransferase [Saprospiraceae bacterium]